MFEKVNPSHPDKVADRIAGALVDLAYKKVNFPKIAVEVLIGHGKCYIIVESEKAAYFAYSEVDKIVKRIAGEDVQTDILWSPQDEHLAANQETLKCGDNGIFKGCPITKEQGDLSSLAREIYSKYPTDGKYLVANKEITICQSSSDIKGIKELCPNVAVYNPLGPWTGGIDVDSGATNRKLGSDMGDAVTGGGLHGKDLSKADVSINIYLHILANKLGVPVTAYCSIGDTEFQVFRNGSLFGTIEFKEAVNEADVYIKNLGGFEKLAEWGLI